MTMKIHLLAMLSIAAVHVAFSEQWKELGASASDADRSIDTAGDWHDASNWTNGLIASGADVVAEFSQKGVRWNSGIRYVKLSQPLTVGGITREYPNTQWLETWDANRRVVIGGDNPITLSTSSGSPALYGLSVFAPVMYTGNGLARVVDFCGPVSVGEDKYLDVRQFHATGRELTGVRFRRDLYAPSASEEVVFDVPSVFRFDSGAALTFVAPRGVSASESVWKTVAGSSRVVPVGETAAVTVGSTVTCEGVFPDGTFVKCIYPDGSLELSATASTSSDGVTLFFGAFAPRVRHDVGTISFVGHSTVSHVALQAMKYAADDDFVLELTDFPQNTKYTFQLRTEPGFLPARIVLRNTDKAAEALELYDCDVEFAEPTNGTACGYPLEVRMMKAGTTANVTVGEGLTATFGVLADVVGTFVKKGAGTLVAPVSAGDASGASGGAISVEEGVLELTGDGAGAFEIARIAIAAGASFSVPSCGVRCGEFTAAAGSSVGGSGILTVPWNTDLSGVTVGGDVTVCRVSPEANVMDESDLIVGTEVAGGVPGVPAMWFDASDMSSFDVPPEGTAVQQDLKHGLPVVKWRDVRGEQHSFCTSFWANATTVRANTLITNDTGKSLFVLIPVSGSTTLANRNAFQWNREVTGIRSVFKVIRPFMGGGPLIGGGILRHSAGTDNSGAVADRVPLFSDPLFYGVPETYTNTPVYVNGEMRDWRLGYPYGGGVCSTSKRELSFPAILPLSTPLLVEFHAPDDAVSGDNFGYNNKFDNGYDMVSEVIVYTNVLSVADRLKVRRYLMEKWLAAELNAEPGDGMALSSVAAGAGVFVEESKALAAGSVIGSGMLCKAGEGRLHFSDFVNGQVSVRVMQGRLTVNSSAAPGFTDLPGNPYIHVDADDNDAFTYSENKRIHTWQDARGNGYPAATAVNAGTSYAPERREEASLGGRCVVDTGAHKYDRADSYKSRSSALGFDTVSDARTVISVLGTSAGGGALIGNTDITKEFRKDQSGNFKLYGLSREFTTDFVPSVPLVAVGKYNYTDSSSRQFSFSAASVGTPGGARTRLNGEDVDGGETGFTGGYDLVSYAGYEGICASGFAQITYDPRGILYNFQYGGQQIAETLLYTNVLSRASVKKVEAYLNKKWFGQDSIGFRPAEMDALTVDEGAVFSVLGGAPATVNSLSVEGEVEGSLNIADGGEITVRVTADGSVEPLSVSGGLSLAGGGTLRVTGAVRDLVSGAYPIAELNGAVTGAWTAVADGCRKSLQLTVEDGVLVLSVRPAGFNLIIR